MRKIIVSFSFLLAPFLLVFLNMFTLYILYSKQYDKTYVGYTQQLDRRLFEHNYTATKGYTSRFRPWTLIYTEVFTLKKNKSEIKLKYISIKSKTK